MISMEEGQRILLLQDAAIAIRDGKPLAPEARKLLVSLLTEVISDMRSPARPYFGLSIQQGRPRTLLRKYIAVEYFSLALEYGHTKAKALALAADAANYKDVRSVEKIVSRITLGPDAGPAREMFVKRLERNFEKRRIPLPPRPTAPRARKPTAVRARTTPAKTKDTFRRGRKAR